MGMENLEKVALMVYAAIFEGKKSVEVEGKRYPVRSTSNLGLRVVHAVTSDFWSRTQRRIHAGVR